MTHAAILACADPHTGVLTFVPAHQPRGRAGRIAVARGNANDMTVVRKAYIRERNGDVLAGHADLAADAVARAIGQAHLQVQAQTPVGRA